MSEPDEWKIKLLTLLSSGIIELFCYVLTQFQITYLHVKLNPMNGKSSY